MAGGVSTVIQFDCSYSDIIDGLFLINLKESYDCVKEDDPKMAKALKRVIRFYSNPDQYREWKESL